jgi:hypothetical protein
MKYIKLFEEYLNLETSIGKITSDVMSSRNTDEGSDIIETMLEDLGKNLPEGTSGKLEGRDFIINSDYTVSVANSKGVKKKLQFSSLGSKINIKDIKKGGSGYIITSKNNTEKPIDVAKVKKIITFVDSSQPETEITTGMFTPDIVLKKI